jgi:hypothetical protein
MVGVLEMSEKVFKTKSEADSWIREQDALMEEKPIPEQCEKCNLRNGNKCLRIITGIHHGRLYIGESKIIKVEGFEFEFGSSAYIPMPNISSLCSLINEKNECTEFDKKWWRFWG